MTKPFAMIIEDDRDTVAIFRHLLDFAGYKTEIILHGERAIDRLKIAKPDIILLDLNLPGISGVDILNFIKGDERLKDIPVVVITGYAEMALGLDTQTDLVLLKPVSVDQLTNLILRLRPVDEDASLEKPRDELTGLYSRNFFISRMGYSIERVRQLSGSLFGIIFLDIDDFSTYEKEKGADFSNFLLTETAEFLRANIRTIDTISRFDRDHFFIQIEDLSTKDTLVKVAQRLQNNYTEHIRTKLGSGPTVSAGIVYCSEEYLWPEDIITDADIALHFAKQDDSGLVGFNPVLHASYREPHKYQTIQRVGLSPKDPTKPRSRQ
ncbi:MAG: diguanylate cyclase [Anaerolineales bacterium]|nr:diguanylate cyclase [Anaerolineales bacterium]